MFIHDKYKTAYLHIWVRCYEVVNYQINKVLLLSVKVIFFKSVNIWQSYKQERGFLMLFALLANTLLEYQESARDSNVLGCNFAK